ncbi:MAG: serine protease [Anaerolineales bacterium]|nr:serine protease [Anaerolineales bacterium]
MSAPVTRPARSLGLRLLCLLLLTSLACNLSQTTEETATPTVTQASTPVIDRPTATNIPEPEPVAISALDQVQSAVVQIVAEGSFVDPYEGQQLNAFGAGSGFFISETGLILTNNHVVSGAAIIWVQVDGEETRRNARLLGVSECSDLAVLQIERRGDEAFPFLSWHENAAETGMNIYAAGYPLGDPEFTLTNGVVSKANANGNSVWASVDFVLEHDATLNPGNSGGPLVTADAKVIGVNYAAVFNTNQYFAISFAEVQQILPDLIDEKNVDAIGINGTVYFTEENEPLGIWVASVESG